MMSSFLCEVECRSGDDESDHPGECVVWLLLLCLYIVSQFTMIRKEGNRHPRVSGELSCEHPG